jgi:serine/threonine protein kinase/Flp pilus assembly protein TadD
MSGVSEESVFAEALEIEDLQERAAFLDRACAGDPALRKSVQSLLSAYGAGQFLEPPVPAAAATTDEPIRERPGTVIGPYRLMEQIGEGGMGLVFVAEQQQPVRRKVALKVIKPGMDSRQVIARFEAERQALALMDHPNIATVHDGGTTPTGRPYFVMELVKGVPITDYCDQNQVPIRQRLELFLQVCQAVQHAHQKGIIHRDIKPSNVLVISHDGTPVVKVIDFGVAKAIGQQLTDKTVYTHFAQLVGTPLYMSPEQAGQSGLDVDTRSDIYSLGVLLYELLTGTTPFEKERLQEVGFDELRRIIREEEPARPSTRLSTLGRAASTVSANRRSEPRRLSQLFRGELDWIVMKALEKERLRRYESAGAFAADVQRYLADEPVLACPPSPWYRLRKHARRHKGAVAVGGLVLFFFVLLGGGVGWVARDRAAQRQALEEKGARAVDEAADFCRADQLPQAHEAVKRAEALLGADQGSDELRRRLGRARADVRMAAGLEQIRLEQGIVRLGGLDHGDADRRYQEAFRNYGVDVPTLDVDQAAERIRASAIRNHLVAALEDWLHVMPAGPAVPGSAHLIAQTLGAQPLAPLAGPLPPLTQVIVAAEIVEVGTFTLPAVPAAYDHVLAVLQRADPDPWRGRCREAIRRGDRKAEIVLARDPGVLAQPPASAVVLARLLGRFGEGSRAIDVLRSAQQRHPNDFWLNHELGYWLMQDEPVPAADAADAVGYFRAALVLRPDNAAVMTHLGNALRVRGDLDGAVFAYHRALALRPDLAGVHGNLGTSLYAKGDLQGAIAAYRQAIALDHNCAATYSNLGIALHAKGDLQGAIAAHRQAVGLAPMSAIGWNNFGSALREKDLPGAAAALNKAIALKPGYAEPYNNLAHVLIAQADLRGARAAVEKAIALRPGWPEFYYNLGIVLREQRDLPGASAAYRQAIALKPGYVSAHYNLGNTLRAMGDLAGAAVAYQKAIALKPEFAEAHCNLGLTLQQQGELHKALEELRRGHELGSKNPRWRYPSALWLRECQQLIEAKNNGR